MDLHEIRTGMPVIATVRLARYKDGYDFYLDDEGKRRRRWTKKATHYKQQIEGLTIKKGLTVHVLSHGVLYLICDVGQLELNRGLPKKPKAIKWLQLPLF